jgi:pimeloyl-ACP methyl ester carboxylesterase
MACKDALADVYKLPTGLPAYDSSHRGDVIRCAPAGYLSAAEANAQLALYYSKNAKVTSGFWMWKIAFRTERVKMDSQPASDPNPEGVSSALLLIPEHPLKKAPLVVFAHGTVGLNAACAPSLDDLSKAPPTTQTSQQDFPVNVMELAGYGYTVIAPDYAGFGFGEAPGYFIAADEAHSVLDSSRAAAHLLPAAAAVSSPLTVALVGHSQGGHAVLSAQAFAGSYGAACKIVAVAAFAPWWTSNAAWGAITTPTANFNTKTSPTAILFAMNYFYAAGELYDGPGGGTAMYQPAQQAAAKQVVLSPTCWDYTDLAAMGMTPDAFFDATFINDVGQSCGVLGKCDTPAAMTWLARWRGDRPALDPAGAPILIRYGGKDAYVTPDYAACARDKIMMDGASSLVTYCYDPAAGHNDIVRLDADYVNQWIAARAGVGAEPATCMPFPSDPTCPGLPANL